MTMVDDSKLITRGYEFDADTVSTIASMMVFEIADYVRIELKKDETVMFQTGQPFSGWKGPLKLTITNTGRRFDINLVVTKQTNFIIETPTKKHVAKRWSVNIPVKPRFIKYKNAYELMKLYPGLPYPKLEFFVPMFDISPHDLDSELNKLLTNSLYYDKDTKWIGYHNMAIIFKGKIDMLDELVFD